MFTCAFFLIKKKCNGIDEIRAARLFARACNEGRHEACVVIRRRKMIVWRTFDAINPRYPEMGLEENWYKLSFCLEPRASSTKIGMKMDRRHKRNVVRLCWQVAIKNKMKSWDLEIKTCVRCSKWDLHSFRAKSILHLSLLSCGYVKKVCDWNVIFYCSTKAFRAGASAR